MQRQPPAGQPDVSGFLRHVRACQNAVLPGAGCAFRLGDRAGRLGACRMWPRRWAASRASPSARTAPAGRSGRPAGIAGRLSQQGIFRWRDEAFDVRARPDGPVLAQIDRGALPVFGIEAIGVHVNGLVERADGPHLWVGRRAADKALDPGKLDHLVAGGVPAGLTPAATLVKEAAEEAAIAPDAGAASGACRRHPLRHGAAGGSAPRPAALLRSGVPTEFCPRAAGRRGGVVRSLADCRACWRRSATTDEFKFNVNLVLIDLFLRRGLIANDGAAALRLALEQGAAAA